MPTKSVSKQRSKSSSAASDNRTTARGRRLLKGIQELADHLKGHKRLAVYHVPEAIDVRAIRSKTGLSQSGFSDRFAIELRTLQAWEQGRRVPDATVRAYLTVIDKNAAAVVNALSKA